MTCLICCDSEAACLFSSVISVSSVVPSERPTRLAIVGASVRAAAQSALRAGFEVVGADLFADADLDGVCPITKIEDYPHGFVDWLAKQDVDAWMYTGALENYPNLVDQMAAIKPLWGVSGEALRRCRDPLVLQRELSATGLIFPRTVTSPEGLSTDGSWLCKTYRSASGSGVWRLDGQGAIARAEATGAVYQEYLDTPCYAANYVIAGKDARLVSMTMQHSGGIRTGAKPFQYTMSFGPFYIGNPSWTEGLNRLGQFLACKLELSGIVGVDFSATDQPDQSDRRLAVLEINPRYTASCEVGERAWGDSFVALHASACRNHALPRSRAVYSQDALIWSSSRTYGKAIIFARRTVQISVKFTRWALKTRGHNASFEIADIPSAGTTLQIGEPVATILVSGSGLGGWSVLLQRVEEFEGRLYG